MPPSKEELGYADSVYIDELGDTIVVVFKLEGKESRVSTVLVRGSTENYMDDIERAIDDGVNTFKGITRDGRFVPGAGATEIELAAQLAAYADTLPGLEQYAARKFATALEIFPKTLAESSGVRASELVSKLYAAHKEGKKNYGFDIDVRLPYLNISNICLYLSRIYYLRFFLFCNGIYMVDHFVSRIYSFYRVKTQL